MLRRIPIIALIVLLSTAVNTRPEPGSGGAVPKAKAHP